MVNDKKNVLYYLKSFNVFSMLKVLLTKTLYLLQLYRLPKTMRVTAVEKSLHKEARMEHTPHRGINWFEEKMESLASVMIDY